MGCGTSKNDVIKSAASSGNEPKVKGATTANGDTVAVGNGNITGKSQELSKNSSRDSLNSSSNMSEGSTIPASEKFGNGSATSATGPGESGNNNDIRGGGSGARNLPELPPLKPQRTSKVGFLDQQNENEESEGSRPMPVAFEVPAEEEASLALIKKHPPRRLRQMEEKPPDAGNLTQEEIEEKVALANERRNQVLHQRVASARQKSARGGRMRRPVMDSELEANETREGGLGEEDAE